MKPLISVIVPVYNVEKYIDRCLESLLNQSYENLEIILVNDGSTDNSASKCAEWEEKDSRIVVVHTVNKGASAARNKGLDICNGELIGFVDSDDYIEESMYEKLYDSLVKTNSDISCCGIKRFNDLEEVDLWVSDKDEEFNRNTIFDTVYTSYIGWAIWNRLYKREIWKDIRFVEGRTREDLEIIFRILYKTNKMSYINEALYNYYISESGVTNAKFSEKNLDMLWACEKSLKLHKKYNNNSQENRTKQLYMDYLLEFYKKDTTKEIDDQLKMYSSIIKKEGIPNGYKLKYSLATRFRKIYKIIAR